MGDDGRVSLLTEIQAAATDPAVSLSDLLRKCQILAFRLRHEPFKQWVSHELNGYPDDAVLPTYRGPFHSDIRADTAGPYGSGVRNVGVPDWSIPAEVREEAHEMAFSQGVGTLESIIADAKRIGETRVASQFSVDLAVLTSVVVNQQTVRMWKEVPVAVVAGILAAVRSKALEFTLEIEAENPEAGTTTTTEPPVPLARADVIFNTVVLGGQNAIGPGATVKVTPGDLGSLMAYLEAQGVEQADRKALEAALEADHGTLGERVKGWLGEMAAKTVSFGGAVAEKAAIGVITAAVLRYMGIG
jgi:hypothetical protein